MTDETGALERVATFSDGVFAIAITLVIQLEVPHVADERSADELARALAAELPLVGSYVLTFAVIGPYWVGHHRLLRRAALLAPSVSTRAMHLVRARLGASCGSGGCRPGGGGSSRRCVTPGRLDGHAPRRRPGAADRAQRQVAGAY